MPLTRSAKKYKKKAGTSLFQRDGGSAAEFKNLFDPNKPEENSIGKFEPELLDYLRPKPEPDTEGREKLKKQARQNVFGRLISSMAQLGGVAVGGDASRLEDNQSPFILNKMAEMDQEEANMLSSYYDEVFDTQKFNINTRNNYLADQSDKEFSRNQQERGFEFRNQQREQDQKFTAEEARKKAKDAIKEIQARGSVAMAKAMADVGVNPNSRNAMEEFTQRKTEEFQYDMAKPYYAPRSIYNYGNGVGSQDPRLKDPEFMEKVRKGRQQELTKLRQQRNSIQKQPSLIQDAENGMSDDQREKELEYIDQRIKLYEQVDVKPDDQITLDLYDIGNGTNRQPEKPPLPGAGPVTDFRGQFSPQQQEYSLQQGGSRTEPVELTNEENRNKVINNGFQKIKQNASRIAQDYEDWTPETQDLVRQLVEEAVNAGLFRDEDEAMDAIIETAKKAK